VHHHRCNPDELSEAEATEQAIATWDREPMFHVSSPLDGWDGSKPGRHHDFIDINDFPTFWLDRDITVEVEAKAKEVAILKLMKDMKEAKTWFVYILRCSDDTLYTGISNDVPRRYNQHNAGTASKYTRARLPVKLLYREVQPDKSSALKREWAIKKLSRKEKESLIETGKR